MSNDPKNLEIQSTFSGKSTDWRKKGGIKSRPDPHDPVSTQIVEATHIREVIKRTKFGARFDIVNP